MAVAGPLVPRGLTAEQVERPELRGLLRQCLDEIGASDRAEASDVVDLLLGVERCDLSADLVERVDHRNRQASEAGVVGAVQPDGAAAEHSHVYLVHAQLGHHSAVEMKTFFNSV